MVCLKFTKKIVLYDLWSLTYTPSYFMAKYFNNILKLVPKPFSKKNSLEFISKIKNIKIPDNHLMMSLDVTSSSTNVLLNLILTSIERRCHYISPNTKFSLDQFILGIKMLMEQNFFKFDHQFYSQTFSTSMGSLISPTLSDFVMRDSETDIFNKKNRFQYSYLFSIC